jgi:hypothetical protein
MVKHTLDFAADLGDDVLEDLPVLAALDGVEVGADQLDAVALQHPVLVQGHRGVQRGLPAEGGQQRVDRGRWLLLRDDLLDEGRGDRLDVGASAYSGSVMMVAGFELTRLTSMPSARSTRQAWVPE